jgi:hypothetical protein
MQGGGEEVLTAVVLDLGAVRLVAVAGIVRAMQKQQGPEPVTEPVEGGTVLDQILVALEVVGPDVLDLVGSLLVKVLADPVRPLTRGLGEGGEPGEQVMDLPAIVRAEREGGDVGEIARIGCQAALSRPVTASRSPELRSLGIRSRMTASSSEGWAECPEMTRWT